MSTSFDEQSFAQEYLSLWDGGSDSSWFSFNQLNRHRRIKNPETHAKSGDKNKQFYILSVDVGRLKDQTVVCVFRVNVTGQGVYRSTLVNLFVLGKDLKTKAFQRQAMDLKAIIEAFDPQEVVIDTNGLGVGIADEMVVEQIDENGRVYPAYGFKNDDSYKAIQPKNAKMILYGIKANAKINSNMHSNAYTRVAKGLVNLLISEQQAKAELLATKKGQKMTAYQRVERLMPHKMTSSLIQEICNLQLKKTGISNEIALEKINAHIPKDKFSSFEYGLWRIKELEDEAMKKARKGYNPNRQLIFFTGGS